MSTDLKTEIVTAVTAAVEKLLVHTKAELASIERALTRLPPLPPKPGAEHLQIQGVTWPGDPMAHALKPKTKATTLCGQRVPNAGRIRTGFVDCVSCRARIFRGRTP